MLAPKKNRTLVGAILAGFLISIIVIIFITLYFSNKAPQVDKKPTPTPKPSIVTTDEHSLPNYYEDKISKFSMKYPADWFYEEPEEGTVIFSGKKGTPNYLSTINIQTIFTKKTGGKYTNIKELMDTLKKQVEHAKDYQISDEGTIEIPERAGSEPFHGGYLIFTYSVRGETYKQMQFIVLRNDNSVFYTWAYSAPLELFNKNLSLAKAMYESWMLQ